MCCFNPNWFKNEARQLSKASLPDGMQIGLKQKLKTLRNTAGRFFYLFLK